MSDQAKDIGQILKAEREKRSLTLDMVHETTKIPMDSLRAIEEGYKVRTLSTFYYKSFVKIYAQYLEMDANAIVAMIPSTHPVKKTLDFVPVPTPGQGQVKIQAKVQAKVQDTRSLNLFARPGDHGSMKKVIKVVVIVLLSAGALFLVVKAVQAIFHGITTTAQTSKKDSKRESSKVVKAKAEPVKTQATTVKKEEAKAVTAGSTSTKVAEESEGAVKAPKKISLTVRARATVWMKVRADGNTVFEGSLKKNNFETWTATKKIELSGRDIDQLDYEANGKSIGKISRGNAKIKKVIVTPDGLNVEK